jgi:hypothetical protein
MPKKSEKQSNKMEINFRQKNVGEEFLPFCKKGR